MVPVVLAHQREDSVLGMTKSSTNGLRKDLGDEVLGTIPDYLGELEIRGPDVRASI